MTGRSTSGRCRVVSVRPAALHHAVHQAADMGVGRLREAVLPRCRHDCAQEPGPPVRHGGNDRADRRRDAEIPCSREFHLIQGLLLKKSSRADR